MMQVRTYGDDWSESEAESFREVIVENSAGDRVIVQEIAGRLMLGEDRSVFVRRNPMTGNGYVRRKDSVSGA